MGCSSSKSMEMQARSDGWNPPISRSFARSFSMPLRQQPKSLPPQATVHRLDEFHHTVALTSSTYGALQLSLEQERQEHQEQEERGKSSIERYEEQAKGREILAAFVAESTQQSTHSSKLSLPSVPEADVIDLRELMKDLVDGDRVTEEKERRSSTPSSTTASIQQQKRRSRMLSRSISSVDSMRELDVKIRSVALALPNLEKKLRALDALNSISRGVADEEEQAFFRYRKNREDLHSSSAKNSPARVAFVSAKSMKGLFYGATLEELRAQRAASIASSSSSSVSSTCSCDASSSSGEWEEPSSTLALFDPEILKTFQQPDEAPLAIEPEEASTDQHPMRKVAAPVSKKMMSSKVLAIDQVEEKTLLDGFVKVCPPRGERRAVLYVTSLRGIRKTFEDCGRVRMILQGFGVAIDERDVSMHSEFRQELKELLAEVTDKRSKNNNTTNSDSNKPPAAMPVPRLFIRGRYVGGVDEVSQLNEDGLVCRMVEGLPRQSSVAACEGCGGVRFVPCLECSGSCKIVVFGGGVGDFSGSGVVVRCPECNENGLIRCPVCL